MNRSRYSSMAVLIAMPFLASGAQTARKCSVSAPAGQIVVEQTYHGVLSDESTCYNNTSIGSTPSNYLKLIIPSRRVYDLQAVNRAFGTVFALLDGQGKELMQGKERVVNGSQEGAAYARLALDPGTYYVVAAPSTNTHIDSMSGAYEFAVTAVDGISLPPGAGGHCNDRSPPKAFVVLGINASITGSLGPTDCWVSNSYVQYVRIDIPRDTTYLMSVRGADPDLRFTVLDEDGGVIDDSHSERYPSGAAALRGGFEKGTYYLAISNGTFEATSFVATASPIEQSRLADAGCDLGNIKASIKVPSTFRGTLTESSCWERRGFSDTYRLVISKDAAISMSLASKGADLVLADSASGRDRKSHFDSATGSASFKVQLPAGTYFIKAKSERYWTGPYEFTVRELDPR